MDRLKEQILNFVDNNNYERPYFREDGDDEDGTFSKYGLI